MSVNIDEQIKRRLSADEDAFSDAFVNLSEVVTGTKLFDLFSVKKAESSTHALAAVLEYYGTQKTVGIPDWVTDANDRLNYVMEPEGIMHRSVTLEGKWYRDAFGAFIGTLDDHTTIALIPGFHGYSWVNSVTGEKVRVTAKNAGRISRDAICFYPPLPQEKIRVKDLIRHVIRSLSLSDFVKIVLCTLAVTLISMVTPKVTQYIYSNLVLQPSLQPLIATAVLLICVTLSTTLLNAAKSISLSAISTKTDTSVTGAIMMRVLNLPTSFFKEFSAGELYSRISCASALCSTILNAILSSCLRVVMSFIYFFQIFIFSPVLVAPSMIIVLALFFYSLIVVFAQASVTRKRLEQDAKETGFLFSMITGMQKIKLAGAERRIFSQWADIYKGTAELTYCPPMIVKYHTTITMLISLLGTGFLYYAAYINGVSAAVYMAFVSAYGLLSGAFTTLSSAAMTFSVVPPILKLVKPILNAKPEVSKGQRSMASLSGKIEVSGVSFRYDDTMPMVIDNLSLRINPGDYVAIVGKSGCGKSTLLRLLLGFEKPQKGAIYYDGKDIEKIDLKSLRRKIGVVMQEGKLFQGDLFSNITISAPWLTLDDAWEAARMAGIADDINHMPMGMFTIVSEGSGGISGGQRQRLMIARAIAPKPKVLMFDEATSALDNITQKKVCESLDSLKCTRIVIAHRLSTIKNCDRIICLDGGHIIEDGTYEELIAKGGFFAELVARQRINPESD